MPTLALCVCVFNSPASGAKPEETSGVGVGVGRMEGSGRREASESEVQQAREELTGECQQTSESEVLD